MPPPRTTRTDRKNTTPAVNTWKATATEKDFQKRNQNKTRIFSQIIHQEKDPPCPLLNGNARTPALRSAGAILSQGGRSAAPLASPAGPPPVRSAPPCRPASARRHRRQPPPYCDTTPHHNHQHTHLPEQTTLPFPNKRRFISQFHYHDYRDTIPTGMGSRRRARVHTGAGRRVVSQPNATKRGDKKLSTIPEKNLPVVTT